MEQNGTLFGSCKLDGGKQSSFFVAYQEKINVDGEWEKKKEERVLLLFLLGK